MRVGGYAPILSGLILLIALAGPLAAQVPPATSSLTREAPPKAAVPVPALPQILATFDPLHTRFGFQLRLRWGARMEGVFPRYDGEVLALPGGRQQVRIRLQTDAVVVADSQRNTELARGEYFFDAARYPQIEFISDPFPPHLLHYGGPLRGVLSLHGVSRAEVFNLEPATCMRAGHDCDVVALGSVRRKDYGLDRWRFAINDNVRFTLRVRFLELR